MNGSLLLLLLGIAVCSCSQPERPNSRPQLSDSRFPECPDCDLEEKLYYFADTVIRRNNTVFVVNNRLDTTVVETGIFTYLQESFPVCTPDKLISLLKHGIQAESDENQAQATSYYRAAVSFYQNDWLKRKSGFENGGFSDLNDYYAANDNISILVSYAFERLGRLPEAISTLAPFLANSETDHTAIQLRYIQLCIKRYGKAATKKALDASGKTVYLLPDDIHWRVRVFGADVGVDFCTSPRYASDSLSQREAQCFIQQQPYYALVK